MPKENKNVRFKDEDDEYEDDGDESEEDEDSDDYSDDFDVSNVSFSPYFISYYYRTSTFLCLNCELC